MTEPGLLARFGRAESGSAAIEYGLLIGMIAVMLIGVLAYTGGLKALYDALPVGLIG